MKNEVGEYWIQLRSFTLFSKKEKWTDLVDSKATYSGTEYFVPTFKSDSEAIDFILDQEHKINEHQKHQKGRLQVSVVREGTL